MNMPASKKPKVLVIEDNCDTSIITPVFEAFGFEIEHIEYLPSHNSDPFYDELVARIASDEFTFVICDGSVQTEGTSVIETYKHLIPLIRPHIGLIVANSNNAENRRNQMVAGCDIEGIMTVDGKKNWIALAMVLEELFHKGSTPSAHNAVAQAA